MTVFGQKLSFFGLRQAVEDPPPYFEGAGCKEALCITTRSPKHNLQHANYLKGGFFDAAGFRIFGRHKILCVSYYGSRCICRAVCAEHIAVLED